MIVSSESFGAVWLISKPCDAHERAFVNSGGPSDVGVFNPKCWGVLFECKYNSGVVISRDTWVLIPDLRSFPKISNPSILISAFMVCLGLPEIVVVCVSTRKHCFETVNPEARHPRRYTFRCPSLMKILWGK